MVLSVFEADPREIGTLRTIGLHPIHPPPDEPYDPHEAILNSAARLDPRALARCSCPGS